MGVAIVGWGRFFNRRGSRITVPAPTDDPKFPWLWDFLADQAPSLQRVGFTAVQLPPASKAQGGAYPGCDGYGLFDPRDIGSKHQQGSLETRYGSAESLRKLVASMHGVGIDVYLDLVLHQRIGENGGPGVFKYLGDDGKTFNGRGSPTSPGWFRGDTGFNDPTPPFCNEDAVPNVFFDYPFGRELSYQNCNPPRVTIDDALDWTDWLFRTVDGDGMRIDDVKGTWAPFIYELRTSKALRHKYAYAEFFDGNPAILDPWVFHDMHGTTSLEDFSLHFKLKDFCNGGDARSLDGAGYAARQPFLATTWVENPDTDVSPGQGIIGSKLLAYAFIMTIEGYPFVYGKDYFPSSVWPGAYGLKRYIDNMVWVHEKLAHGPTKTQYIDNHVIVLNRLGAPGLLTAISNDPLYPHTITCPTNFGPNQHLHDYAGKHDDIWTNNEGYATFTVPSNYYGHGNAYLFFSRAGYDGGFTRRPRSTTQTFFGGADRDTSRARNEPVLAGTVHPTPGTKITAHVSYSPADPLSLAVMILDPDGVQLVGNEVTQEGPHRLMVVGRVVPDEGWPYEVSCTYWRTAS